MQEKSAAANVLPALRDIGLVDDDLRPTQRAVRWRDDELYPEVVEEIRSAVYPSDLRDAIPDPERNRAGVERWFASRTGHGLSAAKKMAAFYELISSHAIEASGASGRAAKQVRQKPESPVVPRVSARSGDPIFKLPGSSYAEVARVIRGYLAFDNPVSLQDVARTTGGMHTTNISRNTGFLVSLGILEGGSKKSLTERGRLLARALDHEMPDEIRNGWRQITAEHNFINQLLSAVRIRGGMDQDTLQAHIAYSAGQPRTQNVSIGAAALIDVLRAADLLRESDGKLFATSSGIVRSQTVSVVAPEDDESEAKSFQVRSFSGGPGVQIVVQVQIQTTADHLDSLGAKLVSLIRELRDAGEDAQGDEG